MYQPDGVSEGWTAAQLVNALRQRGRRVTVLTTALPDMKEQFGVVRIQCNTEADRPFFSPLNYAEYSLRFLRLSWRLRNRYSVVHHVSPITIRIPSIVGALRRPFIWGPIGGSIPYPDGFERYGRPFNAVNALRLLDRPRLHLDPLMRATMRSADRIVLTTSMAAQLIPSAYRAKTVVIPEGIPQSLLLSEPPGEDPYIFSSGRLVEYKAMDLLIRAFAQVRASAVKLVITGDGPLMPELHALIDKLGLSKSVEMRGRVARDENRRLMSRALFCVFPALREAFGHVNLEAMAAWKPVVVTDWGGPHDLVVNDVTGFKVLGRNPVEHAELIAGAIGRLIGDADLRARMGAAAAARIRSEYSWSVLASRYDQLYRDLSM
jgi:glycosyltransferase involved in cell wall biosynthesis